MWNSVRAHTLQADVVGQYEALYLTVLSELQTAKLQVDELEHLPTESVPSVPCMEPKGCLLP